MRSKKYSSAEALSLVMAIFMVCCLTTLAKAADMGPILSAETRCGSLTSPSQTDAYTFTGNAGNTVVIQMNAPTFSFYSVIDLYAPDGILENSVVGYNTALLQNYQLLQSGLYTVVVRENGGDVTSDYNLSLTKVPGALQSPLIRITLNNNEFLPGDTLTATLNIKNGPVSTNVEAKVWIQLPDGNEIRLIQQPAVSLSSNMNTNFPILNYTFTGTEAAGTWAVGAMVENPITGRDISMDIVPFTVSH